jgi:hypothetical protein
VKTVGFVYMLTEFDRGECGKHLLFAQGRGGQQSGEALPELLQLPAWAARGSVFDTCLGI